jgi:hypothetical protein
VDVDEIAGRTEAFGPSVVVVNVGFEFLSFILPLCCAKELSILLHRVEEVRVIGTEQALVDCDRTLE